MNLKKQKLSRRTKSGSKRQKPAAARVPLAKQVAQLRRELRETKAQRDAFAREIARLKRPEIEEIIRQEGGIMSLLKYADAKPTLRELLNSLESEA